ncbi:hypothetical protein EV356DRAFT_578479 [Viridothelium virens]|uniref:Plus3 domain-containing protein n=1 Tax=Viridothelium virens TaxID=1048519 RepID=A0A6A6H2C7_VIRVR|nr:hypothetical protein EV356DRAFT_578479 [Viridothelium virens]
MADGEILAEDDLLLLAGGDAAPSTNDDSQPARSPSRSPSPVNSPIKASIESVPSPLPKKSVAKRKSNGTMKGGARKRRRTDSEEDGEASSAPSSRNSLRSAAMSESESETSPGGMGDVPASEYPLEGKFRDAKDKAEIMAMTEVRREQVLAERAQAAEEESQKLALRRMLAQREREEASKKKRKTDDIDESPRKSTRTKATKTNETLEAYKRQREQRGRERRRGEDRKARDKRSPSKDSDADAEGDSEVEWDDGRSKPAAVEQPPADLKDYQHVKIGRENFPDINYTPGFEEKVIGCFTRIIVGVDKSTGQNDYRMCRINAIAQGKPYAMEARNGRSILTEQYLVLSQGSTTKLFPMIACSQSDFTPRDLERYKIEMSNSNMKLPTKAALVACNNNIRALLNHRWTDQDIENKLKLSGIAQSKTAAFDRDRLTRERKAAVARDDEAGIARIDAELAALEGPKLAFGTSLHGHGGNSNSSASPAKPKENGSDSGPTSASTTARPGRLAPGSRASATDAVRKAQLAEKRAKEKAIAESARQRKLKEEEDARRKAEAASREATPAGEKKERLKERERTLPTFKRKAMDDEIIGSMDLGIDIDI